MLLVLSSGAFAFTSIVGGQVGVTMQTEQFAPLIWMKTSGCTVYHNLADQQNTDGYRHFKYGGPNNGPWDGKLVERVENYAFEGEYIVCDALVMDKNGNDKVQDVYMGLSNSGQTADDFQIEANCDRQEDSVNVTDYNARIGEEQLTSFDANTMQHYVCTFTVETANSMHGEYFLSAVAEDLTGLKGSFDENQYWFLNPDVSVTVEGTVDFGTVRPGTDSYSDTLLVRNTAETGSGVLLNMKISGTDFYDPSSSGAKCPTSNVLNLQQFAYYASNGAYHTQRGDYRENTIGGAEGYYKIPYEVADPDARKSIISGAGQIELGHKHYQAGNVLSPGAEISLTFRLFLPEPCNGDFTDGSIYFWGEAI
jgi:hypothetical protein